jgi:phosphoesterase RecJ-like protein
VDVMKNNTFEEIWEALKGSKKVLMALHPKPDGDSQGSCIAMKSALENEGVNVKLISRDQISENLKGFYSEEIEFGKDIEDFSPKDFDFIVLLDNGSLHDYSEDFIKSNAKEKIINIDHHETNNYYGKLNYVDKTLPSCASIVVDMFKKLNIKFTDKICRALLLGICTDTNFFEYGNAGDSLEKASFLVKEGKINYQKEFVIPILKSDSWKLKKLHGILLSNMEKKEINGKNVFYSYATRKGYEKYGLGISDIRLSILSMQDMAGWDVIFTLTELDGEIKGSFRSRGWDTTIYSKAFGGGGHKEASAFMIEGTDMKGAIEKVLKTIEEKGFVKS